MPGKLILVSGLTGSGKSSLARAVVERVPNVAYLQTVTTRARRNHESDTIEYEFVTTEEYLARMQASANWDHNEIHGNYYGADVDEWNRKTRLGTHLISAIAPDLGPIQQTKDLYAAEAVTVWLDVPASIARARVAHDLVRANRTEDESVKSQFDYMFMPSGELEQDKTHFAGFVLELLQHDI